MLKPQERKMSFHLCKIERKCKIIQKVCCVLKNDGSYCAKGFRKLSLNPDNIFEQESDLLQIGLSSEKGETIVRFRISIKDW